MVHRSIEQRGCACVVLKTSPMFGAVGSTDGPVSLNAPRLLRHRVAGLTPMLILDLVFWPDQPELKLSVPAVALQLVQDGIIVTVGVALVQRPLVLLEPK